MANIENTNSNLSLNWTQPIHISDFKHQGKVERGVYIWGFTINEEFIPYYVGISEDVVSRIYKHIRCILCGEYTIYHCGSLANFKAFQSDPAKADNAAGKLYIPGLANGFQDFLNNRKTLQPHIDFMVDTFTFLYAIVDKDKSGQDLKEIEKMCINQIGKDNLANTRMGMSDKFKITHSGCELFNPKLDQN